MRLRSIIGRCYNQNQLCKVPCIVSEYQSTYKHLLEYSICYLNKVTAAQVVGTLLSLLVPDFVD